MGRKMILGIFLNRSSKLSGIIINTEHQDCGWVNGPCLSIEQYTIDARSMGSSVRLDEKTMTKRVLMEEVGCNLCGSSESKVVLRGKDRLHCVDDVIYDIVRCAECGLVYTNPRPRFGEMGRYYPDEYYSYSEYSPPDLPKDRATFLGGLKSTIKGIVLKNAYGYPQGKNAYSPRDYPQYAWYFLNTKFIRKLIAIMFRTRAWPQFILKEIPPFRKNGKLLDIGCGSGNYLYWMKQFGWEVAGVEVSRAASERANQLTLNVFCGQLSDARFPDSQFDVITMWQAIEHLYDPKGVLEEINRILKDDGLLLVAAPNIGSFEFSIFKHNWPAIEIPRHLYHFSPLTITRLLTKKGFIVEKILFPVIPGGIDWILDHVSEDLRTSAARFRLKLVHFFVIHATLARFLWFPFCYFAAKMDHGGGMTVYAKKIR